MVEIGNGFIWFIAMDSERAQKFIAQLKEAYRSREKVLFTEVPVIGIDKKGAKNGTRKGTRQASS